MNFIFTRTSTKLNFKISIRVGIFILFFILLDFNFFAQNKIYLLDFSDYNEKKVSKINITKAEKSNKFLSNDIVENIISSSIENYFSKIHYSSLVLEKRSLDEIFKLIDSKVLYKIPKNDFKIKNVENLAEISLKKNLDLNFLKEKKAQSLAYNLFSHSIALRPVLLVNQLEDNDLLLEYKIEVYSLNNKELILSLHSRIFLQNAKSILDLNLEIEKKVKEDFKHNFLLINKEAKLNLNLIMYKQDGIFAIPYGRNNGVKKFDEFLASFGNGKKFYLNAYDVKDNISLLELLTGNKKELELSSLVKKIRNSGFDIRLGSEFLFLVTKKESGASYPFAGSVYLEAMYRKFFFTLKPLIGFGYFYSSSPKSIFLEGVDLYYPYLGFYSEIPLNLGFSLNFKLTIASVLYSIHKKRYENQRKSGVSHVKISGNMGFTYLFNTRLNIGFSLGYKHFFKVYKDFKDMGFLGIDLFFTARL